MSKPGLLGCSAGVGVSPLGAKVGGQGLEKNPVQELRGKPAPPSPGGRGSNISDSAQQGGFEPG